ncbi:MAG: class I SAM-dependent methyltransferase [Pseudomonadota bacterium]
MSNQSIYDYPLYYDILFGWDRTLEADFYSTTLKLYSIEPDDKVLEVGCGTGQIARKLAKRGWQMTGLDLSSEMTSFMIQCATTKQLTITAINDDMRYFSEAGYDAAICPMSTVRLLQTDEDMLAHLQAMSSALRVNGIYILDIYLTPLEGEDEGDPDSWSMSRDSIEITANDEYIVVDDAGTKLKLGWGPELRSLTCQAFDALVAQTAFSIISVHPETMRADLSVFTTENRQSTLLAGRNMVVLKRLARDEPSST